MAGPQGLILLEPGNKIIAELVKDKIQRFRSDEKDDDFMVNLCDFDDVRYEIKCSKDQQNILNISMDLPCWHQLSDLAKDHMTSIYGSQFSTAKDNVELKLDLSQVPEDKNVARLRTHAISGIFQKYFHALNDKTLKDLKPHRFAIRADTEVFIVPRDNALTVVFAVDFKEKTDRAVAKIFLQEFADAGRQMGLGAAPKCLFNHNPPGELKEWGITEAFSEQHLGFISFAILPSHVELKHNPEKINHGANAFAVFRNFLQYHIKCSKAYFHSRMRARVVSLLQVLNRAKAQEEAKEKKTFSGRTFSRK